jgi:hypothetical protein
MKCQVNGCNQPIGRNSFVSIKLNAGLTGRPIRYKICNDCNLIISDIVGDANFFNNYDLRGNLEAQRKMIKYITGKTL